MASVHQTDAEDEEIGISASTIFVYKKKSGPTVASTAAVRPLSNVYLTYISPLHPQLPIVLPRGV